MAASKTSPTQNISQIGVLLVVLGFGFVYFWLPQTIENKKNLDKKTADLETVNENIKKLSSAKSTIQDELVNIQSKGVTATKLANAVPQTEDMPGLYIQLEDLVHNPARSGGLDKLTYTISPPLANPAPTPGGTIAIGLTGIGTYSQIKDFIYLAGINTRPIRFSSISLTATTKENDPATYFNVTLTGSVYVRTLSSAYNVNSK